MHIPALASSGVILLFALLVFCSASVAQPKKTTSTRQTTGKSPSSSANMSAKAKVQTSPGMAMIDGAIMAMGGLAALQNLKGYTVVEEVPQSGQVIRIVMEYPDRIIKVVRWKGDETKVTFNNELCIATLNLAKLQSCTKAARASCRDSLNYDLLSVLRLAKSTTLSAKTIESTIINGHASEGVDLSNDATGFWARLFLTKLPTFH